MQRTDGAGLPREQRVDWFWTCREWAGEPQICEPEKTSDLRWFPLTGLPAKAVTRGYHLLSVPGAANRLRLVTDWALGALLPPQSVRLSSVRPDDALIPAAQRTAIYDHRSPDVLREGT